MEQEKKKFPIASILFFVYALYSLANSGNAYYLAYRFISGGGFGYFLSLLLAASAIFAGVWMLLNKRDIYLVIPFGLIALVAFIRIFTGGNFLSFLHSLCSLAAALAVGAFVLMEYTQYLNGFKQHLRLLKIALLALCAFSVFLNLFNMFFGYGFGNWFLTFLMSAVFNAGLIFTVLWILPEEPKTAPVGGGRQNNYDPETGEYIGGQNGGAQASFTNAPSGDFADCYIDMLQHILLLIFTCGVWHLIWLYRMTERLNRAPGAERLDPVAQLLLCLFIPFYLIYWYYRSGQRADTLSKAKGYPGGELSTVCLLLGIFIPIIAAVLLQERMNGISKMA